MRKVKFRAWDKNNEEMCEVLSIDFKRQLVGVSCIDRSTVYMNSKHPMTDRLYKFDRVELLEYTGLKDKNGKEIYEGDIVKRTSVSIGGLDFIGQVEFLEGIFWLSKLTEAHQLFTEIDELEVIGNMYENPELHEIANYRR